MQSLIPVVMAGIIAVYGLVVSVLIVGSLSPDEPYSLYAGFIHLAAGLSCGLTGLAAGHAIGIVGDAVSGPHTVGAESIQNAGAQRSVRRERMSQSSQWQCLTL